MMKSLFFTLLFSLCFWGSTLLASEVTYVATLKGIECQACKKAVAQCLGKLPGVQTIRITAGSNGTHTLTVLTDGSAPLSKNQAVQALGRKAPHYQIVSWSLNR